MRVVKQGYHGFYLPEAQVMLDGVPADSDCQGVFVSHAHADHVPRNRSLSVYASPATAALMRARGHQGAIVEVPFGTPIDLPAARVTLYEAGHILGSSMVFVQTEQGSLLYTGDCRNPAAATSEGFRLPDERVDVLIAEATFALPIYRWAPYAVLASQIRRFAHRALRDGATPVFLCYNLGKAQGVMHALAGENVHAPPVQIHGAGVALCNVYNDFGISLGNWEPYNADTLTEGSVLITPASTLDSPMVQRIRRRRVAYVSGWASLEARSAQMLVDERIALSDHLDFFALLALCRQLSPRKIWLTHSPDPSVVCHYLQAEGFDTEAIDMERGDAS